MDGWGMLLAACIRSLGYDVLIVKGFIFIQDEKSVGGLLLALVPGPSKVSADVSDSYDISFIGQGSFLQPSHHFRRKKKEGAFSCCPVSCGHSKWVEDQGRGWSRAGSFNRQRLPHLTFLLTNPCNTIP